MVKRVRISEGRCRLKVEENDKGDDKNQEAGQEPAMGFVVMAEFGEKTLHAERSIKQFRRVPIEPKNSCSSMVSRSCSYPSIAIIVWREPL